jgi:hypothetical protein
MVSGYGGIGLRLSARQYVVDGDQSEILRHIRPSRAVGYLVDHSTRRRIAARGSALSRNAERPCASGESGKRRFDSTRYPDLNRPTRPPAEGFGQRDRREASSRLIQADPPGFFHFHTWGRRRCRESARSPHRVSATPTPVWPSCYRKTLAGNCGRSRPGGIALSRRSSANGSSRSSVRPVPAIPASPSRRFF